MIDQVERANIAEEIHSNEYIQKNTRVKPETAGEIVGTRFELERIDSIPEENESRIESQSMVSDMVISTKPKPIESGQGKIKKRATTFKNYLIFFRSPS